MKQKINTARQDANTKLKLLKSFADTSFDRHYFAEICDNPLTGAFKKNHGTCRYWGHAFTTGKDVRGMTHPVNAVYLGKVAPKLIEMMAAMAKDDLNHFHAINPERKTRFKKAKKHPNEQEFKATKAFIMQVIKNYGGR